MFKLFNVPKTGQYVQLVTGLYSSCLSYGILDVQGLSIIDVNATQAHGIAQTPLPSFGSKTQVIMLNKPSCAMWLFCMYINDIQTLDIWYTIR